MVTTITPEMALELLNHSDPVQRAIGVFCSISEKPIGELDGEPASMRVPDESDLKMLVPRLARLLETEKSAFVKYAILRTITEIAAENVEHQTHSEFVEKAIAAITSCFEDRTEITVPELFLTGENSAGCTVSEKLNGVHVRDVAVYCCKQCGETAANKMAALSLNEREDIATPARRVFTAVVSSADVASRFITHEDQTIQESARACINEMIDSCAFCISKVRSTMGGVESLETVLATNLTKLDELGFSMLKGNIQWIKRNIDTLETCVRAINQKLPDNDPLLIKLTDVKNRLNAKIVELTEIYDARFGSASRRKFHEPAPRTGIKPGKLPT